ncbi:hypothetical protein L7F22_046160 [Adiantum nelumboides]|nr:hypothetical protein [Adiantum nelumboides]
MEHGEQQQERSYQEIQSLAAALACLSLLYILLPRLPRGPPRLFCVLPCLPILAVVPFSTRLHFPRSVVSFLFVWVCPTKLLLRCWGITPDYPGDGLVYFLATSLMPLRVKGRSYPCKDGSKPTLVSTIQGVLVLPLLQLLFFYATLNVAWHPSIPSQVRELLYCLLVYFGLEGVLGLFSGFVSVLLGLELHPFFDKPFFASSLSEFWGRRWNCLVSYMLRETVYVPLVHFFSAGKMQHGTSMYLSDGKTCQKGETDASKGMQEMVATRGKEFQRAGRIPLLARALALLASFIVSGLFHELLFYIITQTRATGEVTMFFVLHGVVNILEVFIRRKFPNRRKLPRPIAIICTLTFIYFTAAWLFMPPITQSGADLRLLAEFHHVQIVVVDFMSRCQGIVTNV